MFLSHIKLLNKLIFNNTIKMASYCSSSAENVVIEKRDNITLIGINRPHQRNCVNIETGKELINAFESFDSDNDATVAILHGCGGTFCAGFDLKQLQSVDENVVSNFLVRGPMGPSQMLTQKPIIAAVDGYAVAGGFELALWCDMRVMEENAIMGVFCRRFGVPLIDGGTVRLTKLIGLSRAMDLILTGRPITGKEALEYGIANRIVAVGTALGQAYNLALSIAKFPQECLKVDRRSAYYAAFDAKSLDDALEFEFENGKRVIQLESIAGASRFINDGVGRHGKFVLDKYDHDVKSSL